ncbi:MAG: DUF4340 domain-containing protein [Clostridiales bacterium]|nr:DUF4340 domain-containing protein [Clostridiales bacterium]
MKKEKQIIIALAAVIVLSSGYFALNHFILKEEAAKQKTAVVNRNQDDLDSVTLSVWGEKEYTLKAEGNVPNRTYQIANYAPGFQYRQQAIKSVFSKISKIDPEKVVDENPTDLSIYGLKVPKSTVKAKYKDGTTDEIRIGNASPIGDGFYITINGNTVYLSDPDFGKTFTNNMYFFREPDIIPGWDSPADVINSVKLIKNGKEIYEIKKYTQQEKDALKGKTVSQFHMTKPSEAQVDEEYLQSNLLYPISRIYSDTTVRADNPDNMRGYGLTSDAAQLVVTTNDGEYKILIGDRTPSYSGYFIMREGTSSVSEMSADSVDKILSLDLKKLAES